MRPVSNTRRAHAYARLQVSHLKQPSQVPIHLSPTGSKSRYLLACKVTNWTMHRYVLIRTPPPPCSSPHACGSSPSPNASTVPPDTADPAASTIPPAPCRRLRGI